MIDKQFDEELTAAEEPERVARMQAALTTWFDDVEQERRKISA